MTLRLNGSTSGYVEIDAPAAAGSNTLVLPNGNGTNGQYLQTDGSGGLSWQTVTDTTGNEFQIASGDLTSTHAVSLTGIDANAVKLVLTYENVSSGTGSTYMDIRLGNSGGISASGYHYNHGYWGASNSVGYQSDRMRQNPGFDLNSNVLYGRLVLNKHSSNYWIADHIALSTNFDTYIIEGVGYANAGGTLDRIQIFASSGANFTRGTYTLNEYRE